MSERRGAGGGGHVYVFWGRGRKEDLGVKMGVGGEGSFVCALAGGALFKCWS